MSIYITSDIHGCYDEFLEGLRKINFSKTDLLYILGDVVDKGPKSFETLDFISKNKNIIHIKGNHEYVWQLGFEKDERLEAWILNDGKKVFNAINKLDKNKKGYKEWLYKYLKNLPLYKVLNDDYILIHGGIKKINEISKEDIIKYLNDKNNEEDILLDRDLWIETFENTNNTFGSKYYNLIIGHTPMQNLYDDKVTIGIKENIYKKRVICIDTAVFTPYDDCFGQLTFLKFEDNNIKEIIYIKSNQKF